MNTKKTTLLSTLALILATSASAQVTILPGGRGNLYIGTGINLPGPAANISIAPRISLPAPLLSPAVALAVAPAPVPAQLPVPVIPVTPAMPPLPISAIPEHRWKLSAHENVELPYPALRVRLAAPAKDGSSKDSAAARGEKLDNLFDGRRQPSEKSDAVRSDRHQSLPEQDLESEIGAY